MAEPSPYRDFLRVRLHDALVQACPPVVLLCWAFLIGDFWIWPGPLHWTSTAAALSSALAAMAYCLLLKLRPGRWLIESGSLLLAGVLSVEVAVHAVSGSNPTCIAFLGIILLATGSVFVDRRRMAAMGALTFVCWLWAFLQTEPGPLRTEMSAVAFVAAVIAMVVFESRLKVFESAFLANQAEAAARQRYERAVAGSEAALWEYDPGDATLYLSPRWAAMFGYETEALHGGLEDWLSLVHPDDRRAVTDALRAQLREDAGRLSLEHRVRGSDGEYQWTLVSGQAAADAEGRVRIAGAFLDISERKGLERQLRHEALHDRLTGLANRRFLLDRLDQMAALVERHPERRFGVVFFDLDGFKRINDIWGHAAGDRVLVEIANRLRTSHRQEDLVARLGGDEFVVVLDEAVSREAAEMVAERTRKVIEKPIEIEGRLAWVSSSYGVAWSGDGHPNGQKLVEAADLAMYETKRSKRREAGVPQP
ncbi:MAG: diguanylate cyclase [Acidobacteria bacterium]|nr:diguanylate cyclase [Acidobacteriota bacterium]